METLEGWSICNNLIDNLILLCVGKILYIWIERLKPISNKNKFIYLFYSDKQRNRKYVGEKRDKKKIKREREKDKR